MFSDLFLMDRQPYASHMDSFCLPTFNKVSKMKVLSGRRAFFYSLNQ